MAINQPKISAGTDLLGGHFQRKKLYIFVDHAID